jgi:ABC-type cobalamin/Fe3+-siderophores transport system ATPase subunit
VAQAARMADKIWLLGADKSIIADTPDTLMRNNLMDKMFNKKNIVFDVTQHDFVENKA